MPYIGHSPTNSGNFYILDDFNGLGQDGGSSTYDQNANGTIVNFKLMVAGVAITPNVDNLIVTIDGVLQHPTDAYTISGSILTFTGAPASGVDFHVVIMGQSSTVGEGSIGADELQVSGDGTNNQLLKSDGDGTMSWINQNTVTASTAATLATARTIGGVSFDGSANIAVTLAATATTLATARAINGVNFDGSAAITVTAAAGTLTGSTLASGVTASSLTSVGTIGTGVWNGTAVASAYLDADTAHLSGAQTFTGVKSFSNNTFPQLIIKEVSGAPDVGLEFTSSGTGRGRIFFDDSTNNFVLQGTTYGGGGYSDDLVIDVNGKVGIGTASPQRILDVKGTSDQPVDGIFRVLGTSEYAIEMGAHDASPWGTWIQSGYYVNGAGTYTSAGNLNLNPSGGNVGIGTSSPGHELEISAGTHPQIHISETTNNSNLRLYQTDNVASIFTGKNGAYSTSLEFTTQASSGATGVRLAIVGDKVGIGTDSPSRPLHSLHAGGEYNFLVEGITSGHCGIEIKNNVASNTNILFRNPSYVQELYMDSSGDFHFYRGGDNLTVSQAGLVTVSSGFLSQHSGSERFHLETTGNMSGGETLEGWNPLFAIDTDHAAHSLLVSHGNTDHWMAGFYTEGYGIYTSQKSGGTTSRPAFLVDQVNTTKFTVTYEGAVSKTSGSFIIDHPLPSMKDTHSLVHSFTESPRADLIYRDKVALVDGSATINIDTVADMTEGTFVLLCDNVQCFTSNESDWKAVKGSVTGNILTIECEDSSSTAEIAWMVIGDRKDEAIMEAGWTDENGKPIIEPLKVTSESIGGFA